MKYLPWKIQTINIIAFSNYDMAANIWSCPNLMILWKKTTTTTRVSYMKTKRTKIAKMSDKGHFGPYFLIRKSYLPFGLKPSYFRYSHGLDEVVVPPPPCKDKR